MIKASPRLMILGAAAAIPLLAAACEPHDAPLHPSFGNSVRHNMAMHVVNPTPQRVDEAPEGSGARSAIATQRYRTDTTQELEAVSTRAQTTQ